MRDLIMARNPYGVICGVHCIAAVLLATCTTAQVMHDTGFDRSVRHITHPGPQPPKFAPKSPPYNRFYSNPELFNPEAVPDGNQPCNQGLEDVLRALRSKGNISVVGDDDEHFIIFNNPALRTTTFAILDDLHGPSGYV